MTIITPFFNTGAIFHETVKSVFNQSLQQFEWMIINDGTTDKASKDVLDCYRNLDPRIRVIDHSVNCGVTTALKIGFQSVKTEFVFQLDSDNLIEPTTLEHCVWFLISFPCCNFIKGFTVGFGARTFKHDKGVEPRWNVFETEAYQNYCNHSQMTDHKLLWDGLPQCVSNKSEIAYGVLTEDHPFDNKLMKTKRRLLLILPWFAVGGAEVVNWDIVNQLIKLHDHEVTICATLGSDVSWLSYFQALTQDVFILPNFLHYSDFPRFLCYIISSRLIDAVLLSGSHFAYQVLPYLRERFPGIAIMDLLHIEQEEWRQGNYPRFSINLQSCIDLTIVSTAYLKQWMIDNGSKPEKIEVCYSNVDATFYMPSPTVRQIERKKMGISDEVPLVLFVGRLTQQKQPELLAGIILNMEKSGCVFFCLIVGDGPCQPYLKDVIDQHQIRHTRLAGEKSPSEVKRLMAASDLFLLCSEHEGISMACYQAMAMALPVITSDVGGQAELITPECGILIPKSDNAVRSYVEALQKLIVDPFLRHRMGKAARGRVCSQFAIEKMGNRMCFLIDRVVANRKENPTHGNLTSDIARSYCIETLEQNRIRRENDNLVVENHRLCVALENEIGGKKFCLKNLLQFGAGIFRRIVHLSRAGYQKKTRC